MRECLYDDSPVVKARKERYESQSEEVKNILNGIKSSEDFNLQVIKKTRPKLSRGDVFVLNPFGTTYFYGLVLNPSFNLEYMGHNLISVCILKKYKNDILSIEIDKVIEEEDIFVGPFIITKEYWNSGLFNNIGLNVKDKINLDYGFFSLPHNNYINEQGEELNRIPKLKQGYSIWSLLGIAYELNYELVINNSFLDDETRKAFFENIKQAGEKESHQRDLLEFDKVIQPFMFDKEHARRCSITLTGTELGELQYLFKDAEEGVEGNGYDWENLIKAVIKNKFPEYKKRIKFDPEADMFYMYCSDEQMIKNVITYVVKEIKENALADYIGLVKAE